MRFRVAFTKRMQSDGSESAMQPSAELDENLAEGVVAEKVFVEQLESDAQHSQEVLDEDDAFLGSAAPEVWEYEVVDDRADEFRQAIAQTDLVMEFDVIDNTSTEEDEVGEEVLNGSGVYPPDGESQPAEVTAGGSGVRAGDDGPAGMPTGDPSAGGLGRGSVSQSEEDEDLNVVKARDPRLGVTNRGEKPPEDWAADTGPTKNPDWRGGPGEKPAAKKAASKTPARKPASKAASKSKTAAKAKRKAG